MVYHLENPIRQSTLEIMAIVASGLGLQGQKLLPFAEWLDKVCAAREVSEVSLSSKVGQVLQANTLS